MTSLLVANTITAAATMFPRGCWTTRCPSPRRSAMRSTTTGSRWSRWPPAARLRRPPPLRLRAAFGKRVRQPGRKLEEAGRGEVERPAVAPARASPTVVAAAPLAARLLLQCLLRPPPRRDPDDALRGCAVGSQAPGGQADDEGGPIPAARRADGGSLAWSEASTVTDDGAGAADRARHRVASLRRPAGAHPAPRAREPRPGPASPTAAVRGPAHRPQTRPSWFIRSRARSPRSTCGSPRPASRG